MEKQVKSGFVTLIGRPNVGKSTLMNHLIGQKIAITSNKPQTTRNRIQTVYTGEKGQIVFLDTPGIHKAKNKLGEYMVQVAERTLNEVDVVLWLVEPTHFIGAGEKHIAERMRKSKTPVILVINKIDTVKKEDVPGFIDEYRKICDFADIVPVFVPGILTRFWTAFSNICPMVPASTTRTRSRTSPSARSSLR